LRITASVFLGELQPHAVRVQVYSGSLNADGAIVDGSPTEMQHVDAIGDEHHYEGELECTESGSCGFSVRVVPHPEVRIPYEQPWIVWAGLTTATATTL
jgi:hypothetical protein